MGRIKTHEVKKLGRQFMEVYSDKLSVSFDENKKFMKDADIKSKWLRNRVAGYIAGLKRQEQRK